MRWINGIAAALMVVTLTAGSAQAKLLAWWSFNNSADDSDLTNANGLDGLRTNFGHMLDNNDPFDDGWYDPAGTGQDTSRDLLLPVQDAFTINPGALISVTDPGVGIPSLSGVGARIDVTGLTGDNFASGTSDNWGSFSGTDTNRPTGTFAGGSLSVVGSANNGNSFVIEADLGGNWTDLAVSWAQRGTSTGFSSRTVEVSTDGSNYTQVYSDNGALSSSWTTEIADAGALLDGATIGYFRFTVDGASSTSGNNRFDNIVLEGTETVIPAPAALPAGLALMGVMGLRRRRSA